MLEDKFWQKKSLEKMSCEEWEAVCDGCAKCCLQKLEDDETGEVYYTDVVCRYLDDHSCSCGDYGNRTRLVPTCVNLTPVNVYEIDWLPSTCAYRLLAEGKPLYDWHPLMSGDPDSIHNASMSVRHKVISENKVQPDELEERIIHWII